MSQNEEDWGDDLDDFGPEHWESEFGGPDDAVIEALLEERYQCDDDYYAFEEDDDLKISESSAAADASPSIVGKEPEPACSSINEGNERCRHIIFGRRVVDVCYIGKKTVVLIDPLAQRGVSDGLVKVFDPARKKIATISSRLRMIAATEKQARWAAGCYRGFLNPAYQSRQPLETPPRNKVKTGKSVPKPISAIELYEHEYLGEALYWPVAKKGQKRITMYLCDVDVDDPGERLRNIRVSTFRSKFELKNIKPDLTYREYLFGVCVYIGRIVSDIEKYERDELFQSLFIDSFFVWIQELLGCSDLSDFSKEQLLAFLADLPRISQIADGSRHPQEPWETSILEVHKGIQIAVNSREKLWRLYSAQSAYRRASDMERHLGNNVWEYDQVVMMYTFAGKVGSDSALRWLQREGISVEVAEKIQLSIPMVSVRQLS